jgi:hypothetical protein
MIKLTKTPDVLAQVAPTAEMTHAHPKNAASPDRSADELAADLANALWETSALRHGLFTPVQFRSICERVIARRLHQQNTQ